MTLTTEETKAQPTLRSHTAPTTRRTGVLPTEGSLLERPPAAAHLSDEDVRRLGAELDAIRDEVIGSRGARDAAYIRRMIKIQKSLEFGGRVALCFSRYKPAWIAGTGMVALGKILDNMEIGHNVLHGQWDWMRDPDIHSTTYEWDFVAPARGWQHTHNDLHHTWTNVLGKDRDVGYNILRVSEDQPWQKRDIANPIVNFALSFVFEWGIASYDLEWDMVKAGYKSREQFNDDLAALKQKAAKMVVKEHIALPAVAMLTGSGRRALGGAVAANAIRNVWAHSVIFCGHFPDGVDYFTEEMIDGETRGDWYVRQMLGSANMSGSPLFHILTGNLSHQIEHHLFPDIPSNHYIKIAPKVRDICRRYGLPYTTGPMGLQLASTWQRICSLALPDDFDRKRPVASLRAAFAR
ncbi:fatty acid desaturase family protein [Luteipulveratus mongoliensis]|uniref:Fatty acid desaturase n=1 Tax=Luteipulveratus mongoliensis TaxID=571913 RepID=A0A0K1JFE6_9MICO|nr:acyl-CoA desaturase [Luteipulveratus mongoliensis]AKU15303.1 fatty acid desaturase [Luteipulveratus mongoliensis]